MVFTTRGLDTYASNEYFVTGEALSKQPTLLGKSSEFQLHLLHECVPRAPGTVPESP